MSTDDLKTLHVGAPNVGNRDLFNAIVDGVFERRWFTNNGQLVQELEARICDYLGVKHCILVCNATVGLQIACHALELSGEVILPAFTFVATAHALQWERLHPVFADVAPGSHNLSVESIESRITDQTSAIVGVHVWGKPCDTDAIDRLCEKYGLVSMYDAAHAFGCTHNGKMIGNFGLCEVFSFHATKFFNTFEGGAITTNDDRLARKIRLMNNFGFESTDTVIHLGTNGKMSEMSAAMGLTNLESLSEFLAVNQRNYERYRQRLSNQPGISLFAYDEQNATNWQYIVIEVDEDEFGTSRDNLVAHLHSKNVLARRYFYPGCHRMEPYASLYPRQISRLPHTDQLCSRVICLPTGTAVDLANVDRVCEMIVSLGNDCGNGC